MAKKVPVNDESMDVRSNPDILGEDVMKVGVIAVGLAATAAVNDKLVYPLVAKFVPSASVQVHKLVDAGTTVVSAWGVGKAVGLVGRGYGEDAKIGGLALAAGKVISVPFADFSISANFPAFSSLPGVSNITSITAAKTTAVAATDSGVQSTYPRPVAANQYVGL